MSSTNLKTIYNTPENLQLPVLLAFDFSDFNFNFYEKAKLINNSVYIEKLTKKYKNSKNTIVVFNGNVIINNTNISNIETLTNNSNVFYEYKKSPSNNLITHLNKENLNSALSLNINSNIVLVVAGSENLAHYSNYNILPNSEIFITETFEMFNGAKINYIANAKLNENSHLKLNVVQTLKNKKSNAFTHNIICDNYSNLTINTINLNSVYTLNNTYVELVGNEASVTYNSATFANEKTKLASLVTLKHLSPHTHSEMNNVGVVNDFAQLNIDGLNIIENGNSKSTAHQESRIVNLSDTAKSVANPQLIINEYDVKAGHAAAVGKIDADQLYYIMSRGITKQDATELVLMAQVQPIIDQLENKKLENNIKKIIKKKIV